MANIILTSSGSGGDVFPFLCIGSRLKARGHRVTLFSHCCYRSAAENAGLDFAAIDTPEEYSRFVSDEPLLNSPRGIPDFLRRHSIPKTLTGYDLIRRHCCPGDTVLITRDLFDTAARISAENLGIPLVAVFAAPSQVATWKIRVELFSRSFAADINRIRAKIGLSPVDDWYSWLGYRNRSIALWPEWFAAPDSAWPAGVVPVGFIIDNKDDAGEIPDEARTFLNNGEAPILITGGTGTYLDSHFYTASAEACRLLNRRAILVTQHQEQLPRELPDSVRWFSYLPFSKLMANVGAVIHHGGRGTLSCAIAAGVPQLVLAKGADRPDNALRLKGLGVADYLLPPAWQPGMVTEKLHELTHSEAVRQRCKELSARMSMTDPLDSACEIIEDAIA